MSDLILVAVSGGSDSLALLHRLSNQNIIAATVDHGLRPEAQAEAEYVANVCNGLTIKHTTLAWQPESQSAQAARLARYELLAEHARQQGARIIALGHTLDDQAETLVMRAFRAKPGSGTRGMSGMTPWASYRELSLWRPLLNESRQTLRDELAAKEVRWIDDPSNEKLVSERVRIRKVLASAYEFPESHAIGRFAELNARSRHWLNNQTARCIKEFVHFENDFWHLDPTARLLPETLLIDVFSTLIFVRGGMPFRPSIAKFKDAVTAFRDPAPLRKTAGRCLINVRKDGAHFVQENREGQARNYEPLAAFRKFRPDIDDVVYKALVDKMNQGSLIR